MKKLAAVLCIIFVFACVSAQSFKLSYYQEFDKNGNVTREIDSYGYEYEMKYDSHGNTIYCKGALDGETLAEGWLTYYIDGSIKTKTLRDDEGDVVKEHFECCENTGGKQKCLKESRHFSSRLSWRCRSSPESPLPRRSRSQVLSAKT